MIPRVSDFFVAHKTFLSLHTSSLFRHIRTVITLEKKLKKMRATALKTIICTA